MAAPPKETTRGRWNLVDQYLVDTCVLIKYLTYPEEIRKEFRRLLTYRVSFLINDVIKFEFLRSAITNEAQKKRNDLIAEISAQILPVDDEVQERALKIAQIYHANGIPEKQIKFSDIINAAIVGILLFGFLFLWTIRFFVGFAPR